jgi:hypothetical protein
LVTPAAPVDAVPVTLYRLRDGYWAPAGSTRTQSNGSYRFARRVTKTAYFGAEVWAIGDCTGDSTAPQGCVDETRAALDSPAVRIVVRRRRR